MSTPQAQAAAEEALQQLLELFTDAKICGYCAVAAYTWFLYDYHLTFMDELRYVWLASWNLSKILFVWVRIFGIILLTINVTVMMTGGHSSNVCESYFYWEGTGGSIMLYSVEIILQLRIYAMYNKNKWLAGFNAVIFVMEIIVMLVVYNVGIHSGTTLATPEGLTGCYGITTNYLFSIWIPGLIFELWLVCLALYKAWVRSRAGITVNGMKVDLLSLLIRDNVIYFVLIALGLATNTVMWFAAPDGLGPAAVSLSHASMIISGARLLLNLRIAFYRRMNTLQNTTGTITGVETVTSFHARVPSRRHWGLDTTMLTDDTPYDDAPGTSAFGEVYNMDDLFMTAAGTNSSYGTAY